VERVGKGRGEENERDSRGIEEKRREKRGGEGGRERRMGKRK